jgi:hypothetical protein
VLKTPLYLVFVDLLFAIYPDAWLVHTHRDPVKTEPSSLSTLATVRWERSDAAELPEAGTGLGDVTTYSPVSGRLRLSISLKITTSCRSCGRSAASLERTMSDRLAARISTPKTSKRTASRRRSA